MLDKPAAPEDIPATAIAADIESSRAKNNSTKDKQTEGKSDVSADVAGAPGAVKLACALAVAALGFPVFPIKEGRKNPPITGWQTLATTDPETIRLLWTSAMWHACAARNPERIRVVRASPVGAPEAFNIFDTGGFHHRAHRLAGDNTRSRRSGP